MMKRKEIEDILIGKIDFRAVVRDHYATLVDENSGKVSGPDFVLFYLVPIAVASTLIAFHLILGKSMGNVLITALAVFAGLLFNLLLLIFDIANKPRTEEQRLTDLKIRYLKEIYSNIAYSILISLLTITVVLVHLLFFTLRIESASYLTAFAIYALSGNFVLTLLMVLKRIHILLATEFKEVKPKEVKAEGS
jgi:hypothetical protein